MIVFDSFSRNKPTFPTFSTDSARSSPVSSQLLIKPSFTSLIQLATRLRFPSLATFLEAKHNSSLKMLSCGNSSSSCPVKSRNLISLSRIDSCLSSSLASFNSGKTRFSSSNLKRYCVGIGRGFACSGSSNPQPWRSSQVIDRHHRLDSADGGG